MALRIKSHWHNQDSDKSLEEIAGAIAFIAWKVALDKAINLHGEDFVYESDEQRLEVISEYLIFQVQIADRLAANTLDNRGREALITSLGVRLAEYVQDNASDLFGTGEYRTAFIDKLNRRSADYAVLRFTQEGPSYPFLRHLGYEIQGVMGNRQENRWVIDQVMDKDGPEVFAQLMRAFLDLFE